MDLKSGYFWWVVCNGLIQVFFLLECDLCCDVLVVGGGIIGVLIVDELLGYGYEVVLIEQCDIGWGSIVVSIVLLQYEIDIYLLELVQCYGYEVVMLVYCVCVEVILVLGDVVCGLKDVDFWCMDSLYLVSCCCDVFCLMVEGQVCCSVGLDVCWFGLEVLVECFDVDVGGVLLIWQVVWVDLYCFIYGLLKWVGWCGGYIYDCMVLYMLMLGMWGVMVQIELGVMICVGYVVLVMGYVNQCWIRQCVVCNCSSYVFIIDFVDVVVLGFLQCMMVWESVCFYLYLCVIGDCCLLVGGLDDVIDILVWCDWWVEGKVDKFMKQLLDWFFWFVFMLVFLWVGIFVEIVDGLLFFGLYEQWGLCVQFVMVYGGNGIIYLMIGVGLLWVWIECWGYLLVVLFGFDCFG